MLNFKQLLEIINNDSDDYFEQEEFNRNKINYYKSRDKMINMPISDFLKLSKSGYDSTKEHTINDLIKNKTKFSDIPFLNINHNDATTESHVVGHEGRHRARALQKLGKTNMPVLLKMNRLRWSEQKDPYNFDYIENYPETLHSEDGKHKIQFPVKREDSDKDYF